MTLEGGRGVWVISEKNSCRPISGEKFFARKYVEKKNSYTEKISFIAYNAAKKNLTQFYVRKKILSSEPSHPYPPQNSKGRSLF